MEGKERAGREDDGELGGEKRKIFEEQLPNVQIWSMADRGEVYKVFAV